MIKTLDKIVEKYLAECIFDGYESSNFGFKAKDFHVTTLSDGNVNLRFQCTYVPIETLARNHVGQTVEKTFEIKLDAKSRLKDEPEDCEMSGTEDYRHVAEKIDYIMEAYGFTREIVYQVANFETVPEAKATDIQMGLIQRYLWQDEPLEDLLDALETVPEEHIPAKFVELAKDRCIDQIKSGFDFSREVPDKSLFERPLRDVRLERTQCGNEPESLNESFERELAWVVLGEADKRLRVTRIEPRMVLDRFGWANPGVVITAEIEGKNETTTIKDLTVYMPSDNNQIGMVNEKDDMRFKLGARINEILEAYGYDYTTVYECLDYEETAKVSRENFYAFSEYVRTGNMPRHENEDLQSEFENGLQALKERGGDNFKINFACRSGEVRNGEAMYVLSCASYRPQTIEFKATKEITEIQSRAYKRFTSQHGLGDRLDVLDSTTDFYALPAGLIHALIRDSQKAKEISNPADQKKTKHGHSR